MKIDKTRNFGLKEMYSLGNEILPRPVTRGGVEGCRCTPLSSERGVQ